MSKAGFTKILVSGISERDVDLLLLEEFVASPDFLHWFLERIDFNEAHDSNLVSAARSATDSIGESDLEITTIGDQGKVFRILIENKICTGFQPMQAERYRLRAGFYVKNRECDSFKTVLVAPQQYLGEKDDLKGFDSIVTYESLLDWFAKEAPTKGRQHYKSRILMSAIEKSQYGWQLVEDESITNFWHKYWEMACHLAPELDLPEPSKKPASSSFIYFRPPELPTNVILCHKVGHGHVDLRFAAMGKRLPVLRQKYGNFLLEEMRIGKAGKSAVIRVKVPRVSMTDDFEANKLKVIKGIQEVKNLFEWYLDVEKVLKSENESF